MIRQGTPGRTTVPECLLIPCTAKKETLTWHFLSPNLLPRTESSTGRIIAPMIQPGVPLNYKFFIRIIREDFPGDAVVKNPPASAGDTGSIPGLGRSHVPRSN